MRTNVNADAWSVNSPFTAEQYDMVETEANLFYDDFVRRVAEARKMSVEDVGIVARGRVWTGADAIERGLIDELGGLRTAVRRAKVLAGLDIDATIHLVDYPGSSVLDFLRPKASSQPAAASLPDAVAAVAYRSVLTAVDSGERSLTGTTALWVGEFRF